MTPLHSPFAGELMGTLVLVVFGDGAVAGALLRHSKAENAGWLAITAGWGFAVLAGIFTALGCGSPDAHINPAVTVAFAMITGDGSKVLPYISAQVIGAFLGAVIVWIAYWAHWPKTVDRDLKLGVFCTIPAIRRFVPNLMTEIAGTMALVIVGMSFAAKGVFRDGLPAGFGPYMWAILVWAIGLSLGGPTGYAINPARDLGPRLAHAVLPIPLKGSSDWRYAPVPILGPLIGSALGALVVKGFGIL